MYKFFKITLLSILALPFCLFALLFVGYGAEPKIFKLCDSISIGSNLDPHKTKLEKIWFTSSRETDDNFTINAAWGLGSCCSVNFEPTDKKITSTWYGCI